MNNIYKPLTRSFYNEEDFSNKEELKNHYLEHTYRSERHGTFYEGLFVEILVSSTCNLNCSGCDHYCSVAEEDFVTPELFREQVTLLKENIPQLKQLFLWGGEPLLNPHILELVKIAREILPNDIIINIGTNGLLIMSLDEDFFKTIKELNIGFHVSDYVYDYNATDMADKILTEHGISHNVTDQRTHFFTSNVDPTGSQNPDQFYFCTKSVLPELTLKGYKLYKCAFSACSNEVFNYYNLGNVETEEDYIDIRNFTMDELYDYVTRPNNKCKYCVEDYNNLEAWHTTSKENSYNYLLTMKDRFLYNYPEYRKSWFNSHTIDLVYERRSPETWDANGTPLRMESEKNRYFNTDLALVFNINQFNFNLLKENLTSLISKNYDILDKNCFCYFFLHNLSLEEEEEMYGLLKNFKAYSFKNYDIFKTERNGLFSELWYPNLVNGILGEYLIYVNDYNYEDIFKNLENILKVIYDIKEIKKTFKINKNLFIYNISELKEKEESIYLPFENYKKIFSNCLDISDENININTKNNLLFESENDIIIYILEIYNYIILNCQDEEEFCYNLYIKFITYFNEIFSKIENKELVLGLVIMLTNILYKKMPIIKTIDNEIIQFIDKQNFTLKINNHITFSQESLEKKIFAILNKKNDLVIQKLLEDFSK